MKVLLWLGLWGSLLVSVSCAKPAVAGRYVCDRDRTPKDTLDLGTDALKGDSLTLELPGRSVPPFKLEGAVLVDQAGGRWTRQ